MNYTKSAIRAKQRALNSKAIKWERNFLLNGVRVFLLFCAGLIICGASMGFGAFRGILEDTPRISLKDVIATKQATIVYDCEGNELDQYISANSNRIEVTMEEIPKHLGQAFVAIEDERFYQHNGIDYKGILRSAFVFAESGFKKTQGGSTITQQLLKNKIFLNWTSEGHNLIRKIKRKIQEQYLALEVTKNFTKDEILLHYMNAVNLGQSTLGVEAASQRYFGKSCSDLTLSEAAVIAVITQNPSGYNPISHPEQNMTRRKKCLDKMLEFNYITKAEYDEAIADTDAVYERIGLHDTDFRVGTSTTGSYFSDAVYEQVFDDLVDAGYTQAQAESLLTSGGLRIESTMDPTIQAMADEEFANPKNYPTQVDWYLNYALTAVMKDGTKQNYSKENMMTWFKHNKDKNFNLIFHNQEAVYDAINLYRSEMLKELGIEDDPENYTESISMTAQPQAAMVICDQSTGYVVAMVGGRGTKEGRRTLNRATSATRSPGSTFKVLASFAPAIDCAGKTLATVYEDKPFNYNDGTPVKNWYSKNTWRGICSIREAIKRSLNIIAVKNITVITPQLGFDYLKNFGFTTLEEGNYYNGSWKTDTNQSLALGGMTRGVTPFELNAAYASIANGGTYMVPKLYSRVLKSDGTVLLDNTVPKHKQVLKETTAYLLIDAMKDVVTGVGGTASVCRLNNMTVAGKTGTTTDSHDVWFAGFTPYYTCTTWAGYDNNIGMSTSAGNDQSAIAKSLWKAVMARVHADLPNKDFEQPEGIVRVKICTKSGMLPSELCYNDGCVATELFAVGTEPVDYCNIHYEGDLCAYDQLPACSECPFKYHGVATLPLMEDPALVRGSTVIKTNPDGTQSVSLPRSTAQCRHNPAFFANPNAEALLEQERQEMQQRNAAAQAAIDAANAGLN
ncbi:MAG: penicillin-binding protein [Lachnospiraceae bacterium]|nr:penicillin-binding protein [Lachnospiraceae bacterium]